MEVSVFSLSEIQMRVSPTTSVAGYQSKATRGRSGSPYLRSSFTAPFSAKYHAHFPNKRAQPTVQLVRAASVEDKEQEANQSKSGVLKNSNDNIFDLFGYIFNMALGILSQKKNEYEKLEEKVEHVADVVEEVADDVREVAKLAGEIAENVEKESAKDGKIHRTAEMIDKISDVVAKEAEILEKEAEKIEETLKALDNSVDKVEGAVADLEKSVSTVGKDYDSSVKAEKSTVEVKSS